MLCGSKRQFTPSLMTARLWIFPPLGSLAVPLCVDIFCHWPIHVFIFCEYIRSSLWRPSPWFLIYLGKYHVELSLRWHKTAAYPFSRIRQTVINWNYPNCLVYSDVCNVPNGKTCHRCHIGRFPSKILQSQKLHLSMSATCIRLHAYSDTHFKQVPRSLPKLIILAGYLHVYNSLSCPNPTSGDTWRLFPSNNNKPICMSEIQIWYVDHQYAHSLQVWIIGGSTTSRV
jgi:hypothetical protein